jgi:hypothetical protein
MNFFCGMSPKSDSSPLTTYIHRAFFFYKGKQSTSMNALANRNYSQLRNCCLSVFSTPIECLSSALTAVGTIRLFGSTVEFLISELMWILLLLASNFILKFESAGICSVIISPMSDESLYCCQYCPPFFYSSISCAIIEENYEWKS